MKKSFLVAFLVFGLAMLQCTIFLGESNAKTTKLVYYTYDSPNSYRVKKIFSVLGERVAEATNGEVQFDIQAMSPVTNPKDAHDAVAAGIVDIALCMAGVSPGRYLILESINLPGLGFKNAEMASVATYQVVKKFPVAEQRMGDVKILSLFASGVDMIGTSKVAVRSVEDLKGLKLRAAGDYPSRLLSAMGAVPVMMGPGNIYPSIQKGVIEGYNMPWGGITIFKLDEVTKYCLETNNWAGPFFELMNLKKWNSLSPRNREILSQLTDSDWSSFAGHVTDVNENRAREVAKEAGAEIIVPSPEFRKEMQKFCLPIHEDYVAKVEKKGLPGKEILNFLDQFKKSYTPKY